MKTRYIDRSTDGRGWLTLTNDGRLQPEVAL